MLTNEKIVFIRVPTLKIGKTLENQSLYKF